jgi:hypothetical protein
MNNEYLVWLVVLALAVGGWVLWLVQGRLPREEDDVLAQERSAEADWISQQLAEQGEPVGPERIELVLEAHRHYLTGPPLELPDVADAAPVDSASIVRAAPVGPRPDPRPASSPHQDGRRDAAEPDAGQAGA